MRISTFILLFSLLMGNALIAQDYPVNPEPGMCYIRCKIELRDEKIRQEVVPSYKKYTVVPATFRTVEEQVMVRPASKRYEYVPAVYRTETEIIQVEDPVNKISLVPVKFIDTTTKIVIQPEFARFESRAAVENCKSKDPRDCEVICYVVYKEVTKAIPTKKIVANPSHVRQTQQAKFKTITKKVEVTPATVREIEIPAEYIMVQKRVISKDETLDSIPVDAIYREEPRLVRDDTDGGKATKYEWQKIDCKLTEPNVLPIYYAFNSALLTAEARRIIDEKLYKLMVEKPFIRIEINSHTDSRDDDAFNLDLSNRRAKAVVDYLISKGIRRDRLESHGYGETLLSNHCPNGVECTEAQHQANRRTEFRVLPN